MIKKLLIILTLLSTQAFANKCIQSKVLRKKIEKNFQLKSEIEEAANIQDKLDEIAKWKEHSTIIETEKGQMTGVSIEEASKVLTMKELDIALLTSTLLANDEMLSSEQSNLLWYSGTTSVAAFVVGTKMVNKMLAHGYKKGLRAKLQKWVIDTPDNTKAAKKIRVLSKVILGLAPLAVGGYYFHLEALIDELEKKVEYLDELVSSQRVELENVETDEYIVDNNGFISLEELDEIINLDEIRLKEIETEMDILKVKCN